MKKLIAAAVILIVLIAGFLIIQSDNRQDEVDQAQSADIKTYNKDASSTGGQQNVGGSGSDTQPSTDGTGPGADDDLLSQ